MVVVPHGDDNWDTRWACAARAPQPLSLCPFAGLGPITCFGNGHNLLFVSPMLQGARSDLALLRCHLILMPALSSLLHPMPPRPASIPTS